ncbi:MAG: hypothetical protein QME16_00020 [Planctomycetota bacterium]|nr:hypothetical protein [Planctomycetota bacterium]
MKYIRLENLQLTGFRLFIFLFCFAVFSGFCFYYGEQIRIGYEQGCDSIQDTLQGIIDCNQKYDFFLYDYTEGIFDWWDNPFWWQQGYEEGVKKGIRDYQGDYQNDAT